MKKITLVILIAWLLSGCSTQKTLLKGDQVYVHTLGPGAVPGQFYTKYTVIAKKKVKIVDNTTYLIIKDNPANDPLTYAVSPAGPVLMTRQIPAWKNENIGSAYFVEAEDPAAKSSIWYADKKFVLQAATIPVKIRAKIKKPELLDSIPGQTEVNVNIGFLAGCKFSWNRYRVSPNYLGQTTDKFSITPGILVSMGAADLSATSTRPKIVFPRKAPMLSLGGTVVFGFNSFNVGYAFGWDHAFGKAASTWLYKGKMWNGIIVSLDLIK